jgi:hypothetical protein
MAVAACSKATRASTSSADSSLAFLTATRPGEYAVSVQSRRRPRPARAAGHLNLVRPIRSSRLGRRSARSKTRCERFESGRRRLLGPRARVGMTEAGRTPSPPIRCRRARSPTGRTPRQPTRRRHPSRTRRWSSLAALSDPRPLTPRSPRPRATICRRKAFDQARSHPQDIPPRQRLPRKQRPPRRRRPHRRPGPASAR